MAVSLLLQIIFFAVYIHAKCIQDDCGSLVEEREQTHKTIGQQSQYINEESEKPWIGYRNDEESIKRSLPQTLRRASPRWGKRSSNYDFEPVQNFPDALRRASARWGKRSAPVTSLQDSIRKSSKLWGKRSEGATPNIREIAKSISRSIVLRGKRSIEENLELASDNAGYQSYKGLNTNDWTSVSPDHLTAAQLSLSSLFVPPIEEYKKREVRSCNIFCLYNREERGEKDAYNGDNFEPVQRVTKSDLRPKLALSSRHWGR